MTGVGDVDASIEGPPTTRPNYTGAIYGSLLAASVVVGAGAGSAGGAGFELSPVRLAALLFSTGLVFWLAHAYARLVGDQVHHAAHNWRQIRRVARREWPLFQTALPPAAAAVVFGLLGASNGAAAWAALIVAIAEQVGWATFTTLRAGASRPLVLVTALVNLVLGSFIVVLKAALHH
jgi:hypothetical protein